MNKRDRNMAWMVLLMAIVTLLPFLGLNEFSTKGEPREAVVAMSMLQQNNWILPVNNGFDIPFKPPFFHWCIAAFSMLQGYVSEFTSRLPSTIALIALLVSTFCFYARRKNSNVSIIATILTLTAFEVHRAGTNCRVDMVLTTFIVGAIYLLYRWWERGSRNLPWLAILCMSGATLTKGPVGIILPCMVIFIFILTEREKPIKLIFKLTACAILSLILPAMWYYAAYKQGGEQFLSLVMEENVGRFTGKMSYGSHENPAIYNVLMLIVGWAPWTLIMLFSLFVLPWKTMSRSTFVEKIRTADPLQKFTWLAFLLIFIFYCIPKSKRGVYLLPCYPFMAVLIAEYMIWFIKRSIMPVKLYIGFISTVGILLTIAFVVARFGVIPDTIFHGRHAWENTNILHAIAYNPMSAADILLSAVPLIAALIGISTLINKGYKEFGNRTVLVSCLMTVLMYVAFDGFYAPRVMNTKSLKPFAMEIKRHYGHEPLYAFTNFNRHGGNTVHFFGINFYLNDAVRQFDIDRPEKGILLINANSKAEFNKVFAEQYQFTELSHTAQRVTELKDTIYIYKFNRCSMK